MNYVISVWYQTNPQHSSVIVTQVMGTQKGNVLSKRGRLFNKWLAPVAMDEKGFAPMHSNDWDLDNFN